MEIHGLQSLVQAISGTAATSATLPALAADPVQAARFRTLLQEDTQSVAQAAASATSASMQIGTSVPAAVPPTALGDAILQGMESVRQQLGSDWDALTKIGTPGATSPSAQDLMQFQLKAIETSFQFEMVGKVVSKTEQNIEQIVKMQ